MAGRACTICAHGEKGAIEVDLLSGGADNSQRAIAGRYGIQRTSLQRHQEKCMAGRAPLAAAVASRVAARGEAAIAATADHSAIVVRSVMDRAEAVLRPMTAMLERMALAEEVATGEQLRDLRAEYRQTARVALEFFRTIGAASGEIPTATNQVLVVGSLGDSKNPWAVAANRQLVEAARVQGVVAEAVAAHCLAGVADPVERARLSETWQGVAWEAAQGALGAAGGGEGGAGVCTVESAGGVSDGYCTCFEDLMDNYMEHYLQHH